VLDIQRRTAVVHRRLEAIAAVRIIFSANKQEGADRGGASSGFPIEMQEETY